MKKVLVLALALGLSGCNLPQFFQGIQLATTGISNPVTKDMLYDTESGITLAFAGLKVWKQSCVGGALPSTCKAAIRSVQVYTRQMPPLLKELRDFVKNNDQVNAVVVYNTLQNLVANAKAVASANGVQ